jgi:hypothetical protein
VQASRGTLVDTNVLLDLLTDDAAWADWSAERLTEAFDRGPMMIDPIVYAELSGGFARIEDLEQRLNGETWCRPRSVGPSGLPSIFGKASLQKRPIPIHGVSAPTTRATPSTF